MISSDERGASTLKSHHGTTLRSLCTPSSSGKKAIATKTRTHLMYVSPFKSLLPRNFLFIYFFFLPCSLARNTLWDEIEKASRSPSSSGAKNFNFQKSPWSFVSPLERYSARVVYFALCRLSLSYVHGGTLLR